MPSTSECSMGVSELDKVLKGTTFEWLLRNGFSEEKPYFCHIFEYDIGKACTVPEGTGRKFRGYGVTIDEAINDAYRQYKDATGN